MFYLQKRYFFSIICTKAYKKLLDICFKLLGVYLLVVFSKDKKIGHHEHWI